MKLVVIQIFFGGFKKLIGQASIKQAPKNREYAI